MGADMGGIIRIAVAMLLMSASALAQTPPSGQQQQEESGGDVQPTGNEHYTLKFCNKSTHQQVFGAIAVYDNPADEHLTIHAWYKVEKGNCANVATRNFGNFSSHTIFVFGQSGNFVWPPNKSGDFDLCVDRSKPYQRLNSKNYKCRANEVLRKFRKLVVKRVPGDDSEFTYNFN